MKVYILTGLDLLDHDTWIEAVFLDESKAKEAKKVALATRVYNSERYIIEPWETSDLANGETRI